MEQNRAAGAPNHKAHPSRVHNFAQYKGYFAKTDRIDARLLALYAQESGIEPDSIMDKNQLKIKEYSSRRTQLKDMLTAEKQRLKSVMFASDIKRSIKRQIKQIEQELSLVTEKLNAIIQADASLQVKYDRLQTVKGVGKEVALILVTDLPELGELNREKISHLVGVAPQTRESGQKQYYRRIHHGRFYVRKALYMSALVAIRYNPRMKKIYQRLLAKEKLKKVALVAVMRKMIIMLNSMIQNQVDWDMTKI
ncbi:MAG: IS110 family transposase [Gammaproteobacteria bacterium]